MATTSSGMAFSLGLADGSVQPADVIEHCRSIVSATKIPISADLESGFGPSPEDVAETIKQAADIGLAGCSIEDHTGSVDEPIYPLALAVERITAAAETRRSLDHDFVITARCEALLWTDRTVDDVIGTLQAFEAAGADVLFSPGLNTIEEIKNVCESVSAPVSVGLEMRNPPTIDELAEIGVSRVSVGALFVRSAYGALITSAKELLSNGTLSSAKTAMDYDELEAMFGD